MTAGQPSVGGDMITFVTQNVTQASDGPLRLAGDQLADERVLEASPGGP
jgi:hypothetical protein